MPFMRKLRALKARLMHRVVMGHRNRISKQREGFKTVARDLPPFALISAVVDVVSDRDDIGPEHLSALILFLRAKTTGDLSPVRTQWEANGNKGA